uniref:Uncharacterized protein n=1 Tax=Dunaliella tertiolecta TaxID=3047 RepID=A0A7S3RAJ9_DUNTE|mmetsp:Transcript_5418/g.14632  ORF Transcript_5418/g.14632 Transcript_5418/m.14632 type:complete len:356 (-) Transcript_5418:1278-2345(-)|eukprot:CAMPEP_0202395476 /NCGR_PEP_ID=MMETSP1127-20130417/93986_1 /ASSEMBLY_ACC=CAM_ASM_000462 /TAXON_ID=3047 /ORGANISM="Dunaliella tertiolecta, Strain CCMP1320" /LENGTH=355 /DNA_ID=CAMNT_0048998169 /DNA_START=92 /DNA_END=1159 /DNA_ORIENTATION=-
MGCCGSKSGSTAAAPEPVPRGLDEAELQRQRDALEEEQRRLEEQQRAEALLQQEQLEREAREAQEAEEQRRLAEEERRRLEEEETHRRLQEEAEQELERSKLANARDVLEQGVSLQGLRDLLQLDPELAYTSPSEWQQGAIAAATAQRKCRFTSTLKDQHVLPPTYFCVMSPNWAGSVEKVLEVISDHIQEMEPGRDVNDVGVWLSCLADNPYNSPAVQAAEKKEVERALQDALPTLVCMEQPKSRRGTTGRSVPSMGSMTSMGSAFSALPANTSMRQHQLQEAAQTGFSHGSHLQPALSSSRSLALTHSLDSTFKDAAAEDLSHEPTLKLYRVKAGLRGFQGAMFKSVRLVYMD